MFQNKKIIAIIPARGGSKRIPRKNIKILAGKPLIAWTIETALRSRIFDRIIVSTEDKEIAGIAKKFGAEVPFKRPKKLAKDEASGWSVLQHAVKELEKKEGYQPDIIVDLPPTSPLRNVQDIKKCVKELIDKKVNIVRTVYRSERNPYFNMVEKRKGRVSLVKEPLKEISQGQKAPQVYSINDAVNAIGRDALLKNYLWLSEKKIRLCIMPRERSVDIDEEFDFELAEYLMKKQQKKKR